MNKPENMYELCEEVCTSIEASPQNYGQSAFAKSAQDNQKGACGTAFCRAGWMIAIIDHNAGIKRTEKKWLSYEPNIYKRSRGLLLGAGIGESEIDELFRGDVCSRTQDGTEAHARMGIAGMRKFMEKHELKLKAAKL